MVDRDGPHAPAVSGSEKATGRGTPPQGRGQPQQISDARSGVMDPTPSAGSSVTRLTPVS
ncbi:hypothetical protein SAMN04490244_10214 [Tranquillimonas rosea]|uniref:Uncharacterized protein n=1 Tax=Tranquillimonas rosea TaxID=641238 RepID=A0A1H9QWC3_9RHOB|nr:hypothetical protein SAMN04490244_10214 [Tranquillimonas rosea]